MFLYTLNVIFNFNLCKTIVFSKNILTPIIIEILFKLTINGSHEIFFHWTSESFLCTAKQIEYQKIYQTRMIRSISKFRNQVKLLFISLCDENLNFIFLIKNNSPILTILIPSSSRNLSATETFSNFWLRNVGRLLCLGKRFWDKTSIKAMSRSPSHKSDSKLATLRSIVFRCSLAHLYQEGNLRVGHWFHSLEFI